MKKNEVKVKLYKIGKFYNAYHTDGIILHTLLGYKYVDKLCETYKGLSKNYDKMAKESVKKLEIEMRIQRLKEKINSYTPKELEAIIECLENENFKQ